MNNTDRFENYSRRGPFPERKEKILGLGGVGDCLMIIFKLMERGNQNYTYFHVCNSEEKGHMCVELLNSFEIEHQVLVLPKEVHPRRFWESNAKEFDDHLNVFAEGRITIPKEDHHWEPCIDAGLKKPFYTSGVPDKKDRVVVQVNATLHNPPAEGLENVHSPEGRHHAVRPLVKYIEEEYSGKEIMWVGTDTSFEAPFGENKVGQFSLAEVMEEIAGSKFFVGFNSVLLYWALRTEVQCTLFPDHQGRNDLRIHEEWKNNLKYYDE